MEIAYFTVIERMICDPAMVRIHSQSNEWLRIFNSRLVLGTVKFTFSVNGVNHRKVFLTDPWKTSGRASNQHQA